MRTNEPKIWKNNKNTDAQPNLSGSYKKKCIESEEFLFFLKENIHKYRNAQTDIIKIMFLIKYFEKTN